MTLKSDKKVFTFEEINFDVKEQRFISNGGSNTRQLQTEKIENQTNDIKSLFKEIDTMVNQIGSFVSKEPIFQESNTISKILSYENSTSQCWHYDLRFCKLIFLSTAYTKYVLYNKFNVIFLKTSKQ